MNAELKRLVKNLGELATLAENMERLASIEQAEAEANARIAALRREAEGIQDENARQKGAAKDAVATAQVQAGRIVEQAKADAEQVNANAANSAAEILEKANAQANARLADAKAKVDKCEREAKDAESATAEARATLDDIEAKIAKARKAVASLVE